MKEEGVLNVLMYLFRNHMKQSCNVVQNPTQLIDELEQAGFPSYAIDGAMDWLETLVKEEFRPFNAPKASSTRVYTEEEIDFLGISCINFLIGLEQQKILNSEAREVILNQIAALDPELVDIDIVKWVTLMVLFNEPNNEHAMACMELLILENTLGEVH